MLPNFNQDYLTTNQHKLHTRSIVYNKAVKNEGGRKHSGRRVTHTHTNTHTHIHTHTHTHTHTRTHTHTHKPVAAKV